MAQVFSPWQAASPAVSAAFAREAFYPPLFPVVLRVGRSGAPHRLGACADCTAAGRHDPAGVRAWGALARRPARGRDGRAMRRSPAFAVGQRQGQYSANPCFGCCCWRRFALPMRRKRKGHNLDARFADGGAGADADRGAAHDRGLRALGGNASRCVCRVASAGGGARARRPRGLRNLGAPAPRCHDG